MVDQESVQVIRAAYAALEAGDAVKMLAVCADDVAWIYPGSETLVPVAGEFVGRIGIEEFFELLNEDESFQVITPKEFLQHGERIIVLGHYCSSIKSTGREYETDFVHIFTLRDGKIIKFQDFFDTAAELEAYGMLVFP